LRLSKRIALLHKKALQTILNKKSAVAAKNWKKALRGFMDHCISLEMIETYPLLGVKLTKVKSKPHRRWTPADIERKTAPARDEGTACARIDFVDRAGTLRRGQDGTAIRSRRNALHEPSENRSSLRYPDIGLPHQFRTRKEDENKISGAFFGHSAA
jgi:hypothetical protein